MGKSIFLYVLLVLSMIAGPVTEAQPLPDWVRRFNSLTDSTDVSKSIAADNAGNIFVTGYSKTLLLFTNIITIKYAPDGTQLWQAEYDGPAHLFDEGAKVVTDNAGNVYVTGFSYGLLSLSDYITLKYNNNGNLLWAARYNGSSNLFDEAADLKVDALGNVYVTGTATNHLIPQRDYTTIKYNSSGVQQWAVSYDAGFLDEASAIGIDGNYDIYVTGTSRSGLLPGSEDMATVKYSNSGGQVWERRYNGSGNNEDRSYAIIVDNSDNVIITGSSRTGAAPGSEDAATINYRSDGTLNWTRTYNGAGNNEDRAYAIIVDNSDNIIITGESDNANSNPDYMTVKYSPAGGQVWASAYNGTGNNEDRAYAIIVDNSDNIYVTGESMGNSSSYDYATVKYDRSGNEQWAAVYNGTGNGEDRAYAIIVDNSDHVVVTGTSMNGVLLGTEDYLTIKYGEDNKITVINGGVPVKFSISQNFPNPFNPATNIMLELPKQSNVKIDIFDILGVFRESLLNKDLAAGIYNIKFSAEKYPSGMYFCRIWTSFGSVTRKMMLVK